MPLFGGGDKGGAAGSVELSPAPGGAGSGQDRALLDNPGLQNKTYDTTNLEDDDKSDLTDENYESDEVNIEANIGVDNLETLVMQAQDIEGEVREKIMSCPPWLLRALIAFFSLLGTAALVLCILYLLKEGPTDTIRVVVLVIAVVGNCLGSCAIFYSGSFAEELKTLSKGVQRLQFASDNLKGHVDQLTKHKQALEATHNVLKEETEKLKDENKAIRDNEQLIVETSHRINYNTQVLEDENNRLQIEHEELKGEGEKYARNVDAMKTNQDRIQQYNEEAKERVIQLNDMVETLQQTVPELNRQVDRFRQLRVEVEQVSAKMGGDVDETTKTVNQIFAEIQELTIRQERVMLYQLMERILSTNRKDRDHMDRDMFRRFTAQIPEGYEGHKFDELWFGRTAVNGVIHRSELKFVIDSITLEKAQKNGFSGDGPT